MMKVYTDDDLRRIDRTWLGPPGRRLPWVATYRQYVTIVLLGLLIFALMVFLGCDMTKLGWLGIWGLATYLSVKGVNAHYRDDVGIIVNFITAYQELTVPRADSDEGHDETLALMMTRQHINTPYSLNKTGRQIMRRRIIASHIRDIRDRRNK